MMWRARFTYVGGEQGNTYHFETHAEALEFVLDRRYGVHARIWKEVPRGRAGRHLRLAIDRQTGDISGAAPDDGQVHAGVGPGHVQRSDCPCSPKLTHFESQFVEPCDVWVHGDLIDKLVNTEQQ